MGSLLLNIVLNIFVLSKFAIQTVKDYVKPKHQKEEDEIKLETVELEIHQQVIYEDSQENYLESAVSHTGNEESKSNMLIEITRIQDKTNIDECDLEEGAPKSIRITNETEDSARSSKMQNNGISNFEQRINLNGFSINHSLDMGFEDFEEQK